MKNWKAVLTGFLVLCLLIFAPVAATFAEEDAEGQEEETEEAIPDSYYYPIESNQIKDWPQGPAIEAAAATVMDMDTGTFLYSKNATEKMYPASITKIMTTLLLVENCDLDDEITFSEIVYDLEEGSSHQGIQPGEKMTLRDAAYGIMLESANDISNGVAEYMGGSISGFADMMNARAAEIGCVNTHFSNPHGLYSDDHYTCAYDMALIAKTAYQNPTFREIATTRYHTIPETNLVEEERYLMNHHKMMHEDSEYYWQYVAGGKNGFTSQCLNTLVTYAQKDGRSLVSVILRVNGAGKAYDETRTILGYGFDNFSTVNYKRNNSSRTFYDIMGLSALGASTWFQSDVWRRTPAADCSISLTLPNTVSADRLTLRTGEKAGNSRSVIYEYEGTAVGVSRGTFYPIYAPAQLSFEGEAVVAEPAQEEEAVSAGGIRIENLDGVLAQTAAIFESGFAALEGYTSEHTVTVLAAGAVVLVILIVFIVVLIFRCTSDMRIKRRRKQEEKERKLREEEIERMTTAEIEAELRAVMEQERIRKEQEVLRQEEAVRAAEESRRLEEEAHETERLLQELEEERLQRRAKGDAPSDRRE